MGGYTERFMKLLLGWMKTLFDSIWGYIGSEDSGSFFRWLGSSWWLVALVLIGAGLVVDWIIWMIRWQPYHVWATRFRRIRRLFTRASGNELESAAQYTAQYAMTRGGYDGTPSYAAAPDGYGDAYQDEYAQAAGSVYDEDTYEEDLYEEDVYEEDDAYGTETYAAADGTSYDDTQAIYCDDGAVFYDAPMEDGYDAQQAYRRPMTALPVVPEIPDAQLRDYPGRRYDPNRMPYQPQQIIASRQPDPLAPYDAYEPDAWTDAYYEEDADGQTLDEMAELDAAPMQDQHGTPISSGRRARRKVEGDVRTEQRMLYGRPQEDEPAQASPALEDTGRRRRRAQRPTATGSMSQRPADQGLNAPQKAELEDAGAAMDSDELALEDADWDVDQLPEAPRWPTWDARAPQKQTKKKSLVQRVRDPDVGRAKKRGKLAQIFDPQEETVKSLPPRVDQRHAFYEPAYPQQDEDWTPDEGEDE